jgi:NitT/TauT family transport system substrate-binding protein
MNMTPSIGRSLMILAPLVLATFSTGVVAKEIIRVGMVVSWPGSSFYALAREKQLAPDYDIEVTNFEDPLAAQNMLAAGQIDIVEGTMEYAPIAAERGLPIANVAFVNPSYGVDQITLAPGMEPADLAGKKVSAPEAYIGQLMMGVWLDEAGIAPNDVEWVNLNADEAVGPMLSGDLAAAYMYEPWVSKLTANLKGARSVASTADPELLRLGMFGDALYMNKNFIASHHQAALDMLRTRWEALQYWHDHTAEANQFFADFLQWPVADVESVMGTNGKSREGGNYMLSFNESARFCGVMEGEPPLGLTHGGMLEAERLTNEWWVKLGVVEAMHDPRQGTDCSLMGELAQKGYRQEMEAHQ